MSESSKWNPGGEGVDSSRLQPESVRGWRNEMTASMNDFLSRLRNLESVLATQAEAFEASGATQFRASEPQQTPPYASQPSGPPPAASGPPPSSTDENEFDARLANLKKRLAERLNAESNKS